MKRVEIGKVLSDLNKKYIKTFLRLNSKKYIIAIAAIFFSCVVYTSNASASIKFDPNQLSDNITNIEYFSGMYVALGQSGIIKTSQDGANWTVRMCIKGGITSDLQKASDKLVAYVGNSFYSSTDGIHWVKVSNFKIGDEDVLSFAYNGKAYVAIGYYGFYYSKDLKSWKMVKNIKYKMQGWNKISWSGNKFVAIGFAMSATSIDGIKWVQGNEYYLKGSKSIMQDYDVVWTGKYYLTYYIDDYDGNNYLVDIFKSSDGLKWKACASLKCIDGYPEGGRLRYFNNTLYYCASDRIWYSRDFKTWKNSKPDGDSFGYINDMAFNGKTYVAACNSENNLLLSDDGVKWRSAAWSNYYHYQGVASNGKIDVLLARCSIHDFPCQWKLIVKDGSLYKESYSITDKVFLYKIIYADGKFVIVGDHGSVLVSEDGMNWEKAEAGINSDMDIENVVWAGNNFIAFTEDGGMLESNDALNWTSLPFDDIENLNGLCDPHTIGIGSIICFKGAYFAFGSYGDSNHKTPIVLKSKDLQMWNVVNIGTDCSINYAEVIKDKLVLITDSNTIISTTDGNHWTSKNAILKSDDPDVKLDLGMVAYSGTYYVAIPLGDSLSSYLFTSKDSITWTKIDLGIQFYEHEVLNITCQGDTFIGVGFDGIVVTGKP